MLRPLNGITWQVIEEFTDSEFYKVLSCWMLCGSNFKKSKKVDQEAGRHNSTDKGNGTYTTGL